MKKLSVITFILLSVVFTFAQNSADWQKFSPDGEEFVVEVPKKMLESVNLKEVDENKFDFGWADYRMYFNQTYYLIYSFKISPLKTATTVEFPADLKSFINEFDKEPETVKFGDFDGEKYEFRDSEDFYHTILFINTNNRAYRFHTVQEKGITDEETRFWNSIHFFQEVLKPKTFEIRDKIIRLDDYEYFNTPKPKPSAQNQPKPVETDVIPIKIISKPRASYTDLARSLGMMGTTTFSVEFLASGEIGKITPIKKLPFGLTQNSKDAIKAIKFQPETKAGVPITVTKTLQYSFTLY